MKASVVVGTYNRCDSVRRCLDALTSLDFPTSEHEIIVVDDGSTDGTAAFLDERAAEIHNLSVIHQENRGAASARNTGIAAASGEYVFFTDDDCLVPSDWISVLLDGFESGIGAVSGTVYPTEEKLEQSIFARLHRHQVQSMYPDSPVTGGRELFRGEDAPVPLGAGGTSNIAYRKEVLEQVDGVAEVPQSPHGSGADIDLLLSVVDEGYDVTFLPVAARHFDDYTWTSFTSRAFRHGSGRYYLEQERGGNRSAWTVLAQFLTTPALLPVTWYHGTTLPCAALHALEHALLRAGELRAILSNALPRRTDTPRGDSPHGSQRKSV